MKQLVSNSLQCIICLTAGIACLDPLAACAQDYATVGGVYDGNATFTLTYSVLGLDTSKSASTSFSDLEVVQTGNTFTCTLPSLGQDLVCTGTINGNKLVSVSAPAVLFWDSSSGSISSGQLSGGGQVSAGQIVLNLGGKVKGEIFGISDNFDAAVHVVLHGPAVPVPTFATNFPSAAGTYAGLFCPASEIAPANSGSFTLTLTAKGAFSGKLQIAGTTGSFHGQFSAGGTYTNSIVLRDSTSLTVGLRVDSAVADSLSGAISGPWQAAMIADRLIYDARGNSAPQAGRYTMIIEGATNDATLPAGDGYATVTVSPAGKVSLAATLADGTKITQTASVSKHGLWPLYAPTSHNQGLLLSWISFTNAQTLGGTAAWVKPHATAKYYSEGFSWMTQASGARYSAPGNGANILGAAGSTFNLTMTGGNLSQGLTNQLAFNSFTQARNLAGANKAQVTFVASTGLFRGNAVDPLTRKSIPFNGVLIQNQNGGSGYFLGAEQSGRVTISP